MVGYSDPNFDGAPDGQLEGRMTSDGTVDCKRDGLIDVKDGPDETSTDGPVDGEIVGSVECCRNNVGYNDLIEGPIDGLGDGPVERFIDGLFDCARSMVGCSELCFEGVQDGRFDSRISSDSSLLGNDVGFTDSDSGVGLGNICVGTVSVAGARVGADSVT